MQALNEINVNSLLDTIISLTVAFLLGGLIVDVDIQRFGDSDV